MIVADENLHSKITKALIKNGYSVLSIAEFSFGISDLEVIGKAKEYGGIIVTEDKDFGELVFSDNLKSVSVIFLRYKKSDLDKIIENLIKVLEDIDLRNFINL